MTDTLVVGAAPIEDHEDFYRALLMSARFVVAADAAGEWCVARGRVPDMVVGDFDSSEPGAADRLSALGSEVLVFPARKDQTDLDLAVAVASERGGGAITVTAAFTGRIDHTLAAVGAIARAGAGAREPGWQAWACAPGADVTVDAAAGECVSVMAVGEATGVTLTGTEWRLSEARLGALSGHGVSNRALGGPVTVSVRSGALVIFLQSPQVGEIY